MHTHMRHSLLSMPFSLSLLLFCSGPDGSTGLGSEIIEGVYPGQVTVGDHIRLYSMDTSACDSSFSLPGPGDTGFGVHHYNTTTTRIFVGDSAGDTAVGFIQYIIAPDTGASRFYADNDSLTHIVLKFYRDSGVPADIEIRRSRNGTRPLKPSDTAGCPVLDTLHFVLSDSTASVTISPDSADTAKSVFIHAIFAACTTTTKDSLYLKQLPTFEFIGTNITGGTKVRLSSRPQMIIRFNRNAADTSRTYSPYQYCYIASDPDSLRGDAWLSYAPKRTAVFSYEAAPLWSVLDTRRAQIVSAVFSLTGPAAGDTLRLRYLRDSSLLRKQIFHHR